MLRRFSLRRVMSHTILCLWTLRMQPEWSSQLSMHSGKGWLASQGLVCVEQPTDHAPFDSGSFDEMFSRRYGRTSVMVLKMRVLDADRTLSGIV